MSNLHPVLYAIFELLALVLAAPFLIVFAFLFVIVQILVAIFTGGQMISV